MADPLVITAVIASGGAIAQPWLIALWKNYIRKGKVEPYVTGFAELGFSTIGPTIAVDGTLRALDKEVFIKSMNVIVKKHKDSSIHEFEWVLFRSNQFTMPNMPPQSTVLETASGFLVTPNAPKRICILFSDSQTRQEMQSYLNAAYNRFWDLRHNDTYQVLDQAAFVTKDVSIQLRQQLAEEYRKDAVRLGSYTEIDRLFYWDAGKYDFELSVCITKPDKTFIKKWEIELTKEQIGQLRCNIVGMLDSILYTDANLVPPNPFFIYANYQ